MLADTTPFRDGLGQMAGILPQWVLADGWEEASAAPPRPGGARAAARRVRPLLALHPPRRVAPRAPPGEPRVSRSSRASPSTRSRAAVGKDPWDCYFDDPRRRRAGARERPAGRRALHRRAPGRDDLAPALLPRRRRLHERRSTRPLEAVTRHPVCFAGHVHYLTHHVGELGTLPLEEAIRKMTSMPARALRPRATAARSRPGTRRRPRRARPRPARRTARRSSIRSPTCEASSEVLVNGVAGRRGRRAHRAPGRRPRTSRRDVIDLRSDFCAAADRRDVGGDAGGRARLGDAGEDESRQPARAASARSCSARRRRCSSRRARWRTSPRCSRSATPGEPGRRASRTRTSCHERGHGHRELAGLEPVAVDELDGRWRRRRRRGAALPREHAHARGRHGTRRRTRPATLAARSAAASTSTARGSRTPRSRSASRSPRSRAPVDTVALSLNKGLCAPFGALLAGERGRSSPARAHLRRLGGGTIHKAGLARRRRASSRSSRWSTASPTTTAARASWRAAGGSTAARRARRDEHRLLRRRGPRRPGAVERLNERGVLALRARRPARALRHAPPDRRRGGRARGRRRGRRGHGLNGARKPGTVPERHETRDDRPQAARAAAGDASREPRWPKRPWPEPPRKPGTVPECHECVTIRPQAARPGRRPARRPA